MTLAWLALAVALAQDPSSDTDAPPPAADPAPADDSVVVTVAGPDQVTETLADVDGDGVPDMVVTITPVMISAARDQIVRSMEALGWRKTRSRDGRIYFRGPEGWMGKAILMPSGDLEFDAPVLALGGSQGNTEPAPRALDQDARTGNEGVTVTPFPSRNKIENVQAEVRAAMADEVRRYRELKQYAYLSAYVAAIPERLDALWTAGESLDGGSPIADPTARRLAVLDFWASRTDTPEGRVVSRTIEDWIRGTIMDGEHPVTREEAAAAEANREDGRKLDVF